MNQGPRISRMRQSRRRGFCAGEVRQTLTLISIQGSGYSNLLSLERSVHPTPLIANNRWSHILLPQTGTSLRPHLSSQAANASGCQRFEVLLDSVQRSCK
jgi:hypothetical protein